MIGWLVATLYVLTILGIAEGLRRTIGLSSQYTRKVVHIGVGMLSWLLPYLFDSPQPFIATCLVAAILTFIDSRLNLIPAMASADDSRNLGTVYFPLAAAAIVYWFWDQPALMVAALMPLTWGDGMAEVIGRKFGRNPYTIFNHTRSWQGTTAFVCFGWPFTALALIFFGIPAQSAILPALVTTLLTAAVEAISIAGLDNLTITLVAAIVLTTWPF